MLGKFLHARLSGTSAGQRIYPLFLPQSPEYPAATYTVLSVTKVHAHGGDSPLRRTRVQLDAWADSYAAARQLAQEIEAALSRFRGSEAGIVVHDSLHTTERELYEPDLYRVSADYVIHFEVS